MNPLKSPLHRTAATLAGAFLGMAGAVAVAAPASAHHPILQPVSSCANADGTWKVVWEVTNSERDIPADIADMTPADGSVTGIAVGSVLPKLGEGVLTAQQSVGAGITKAELKVTAHWLRNGEHKVNTASGEMQKPGTPCVPTSPSPSAGQSSPSPSVSVTASSTASPSTSASTSTSPSTSPSTSAYPSASPAPSTSVPPITEPEYVFDETCDTFTVGIDNPAGFQDLTVTFTPSVGTPKTVEAPAGKVTTVDFPASKGLKVTATPKGFPDEAATVSYKAPEDCDSSGGAGGEPGLPLTGAAAGSIAGGAALLVGLGATLFVMARRRKVRFTA